jgi:hypothetical protein
LRASSANRNVKTKSENPEKMGPEMGGLGTFI